MENTTHKICIIKSTQGYQNGTIDHENRFQCHGIPLFSNPRVSHITLTILYKRDEYFYLHDILIIAPFTVKQNPRTLKLQKQNRHLHNAEAQNVSCNTSFRHNDNPVYIHVLLTTIHFKFRVIYHSPLCSFVVL